MLFGGSFAVVWKFLACTHFCYTVRNIHEKCFGKVFFFSFFSIMPDKWIFFRYILMNQCTFSERLCLTFRLLRVNLGNGRLFCYLLKILFVLFEIFWRIRKEKSSKGNFKLYFSYNGAFFLRHHAKWDGRVRLVEV